MANITSPRSTTTPRAPPRFHRSGIGKNSHQSLSSPRFSNSFRNVPSSRSMFVVDPKTLATRLLVKPNFDDVLEGTNTRLVRLFVWLKRLSESWFTHVLLLIALILYACLGGAIFSTIEGNHEKEQNAIIRQLYEPIDQMTDKIIDELWRYRQNFPLPNDHDDDDGDNEHYNDQYVPIIDQYWYLKVEDELDRFDWIVREQCSKRLNYSIERFGETDRWDFIGSVFFSMTVFTTIGYGDSPPVTTLGKTATMIYSFFGIPLLLIVLADFGRIFTKIIKYLIMSCRRIYYDRSLRSVRHMGRKATRSTKFQQAIMDTLNKIQRQPPFFIDSNTGRVTMLPPPEISQPNLQSTTNPMMASSSSSSSVLYRQNPIPMVTISPSSPTSPSTMMTPETPMPTMLDFDEMDDEFNLPISLALAILMLYLFLGAILFWAFENWTLFQAFYFVFISMSTIGFGDFVPTQFNVLLYAFIYFLFGLALTSMCINVIQEKLSSTFEKARVTIGESIGLDPSTPITIVNPNLNPLSQETTAAAAATSSSSKSSSRQSSPEKPPASTTKTSSSSSLKP
ncbi:potassium channel subfamily k-like protein 2 [Dermatophagoides farinae]|uniref:Potassium channel subfamily k-like protein 2 n=1 Tax=Dermatophagoides farinae TaxID=6954 RepID=A0A9D4P252_DERFA|nr:uncoordinated protein 58-like [Dermatophagoides farinae]KAH7643361.1 potassium channel subfamily k-like protein 2 [Dermatophagoides farinae]